MFPHIAREEDNEMENAVLWLGMAISFAICFFAVRRLGRFPDEVNGTEDGHPAAKKRAQVVVVKDKAAARAEAARRSRRRTCRGTRWPAA